MSTAMMMYPTIQDRSISVRLRSGILADYLVVPNKRNFLTETAFALRDWWLNRNRDFERHEYDSSANAFENFRQRFRTNYRAMTAIRIPLGPSDQVIIEQWGDAKDIAVFGTATVSGDGTDIYGTYLINAVRARSSDHPFISEAEVSFTSTSDPVARLKFNSTLYPRNRPDYGLDYHLGEMTIHQSGFTCGRQGRNDDVTVRWSPRTEALDI